ncbi:transposase [Spirosoma flavus]
MSARGGKQLFNIYPRCRKCFSCTTEAQIEFALKQTEIGVVIVEVCRKINVNEATFYNFK